MIEYTYRGYVVQQRGNRHRILGMDRTVPSEAAVMKAIDYALNRRPTVPHPFGAVTRTCSATAGVRA